MAYYQPTFPQYQQTFPQAVPQPAPQSIPQAVPQQQTSSGIVWVQGLEGAKAYPVAAGSSVMLMDSEESVFYIKTTDQSGMPSPLRVFDYNERKDEPAQPKVDTSTFITRDEFEKAIADLKRKPKKEAGKDE